jgi:hypothetical protein
MYAVLSMNDAKYQPLADYTWTQNKAEYCKLHGYAAENKTENFRCTGKTIGFEKIFFALDLLNEHPEYKWIWWTGCDAMITNFTIKIEDKIDPAYDLIMVTDCNEINNDSFLMKNSQWSKDYLQYLIDVMPKYTDHYFYEQQAMIESYPSRKDHIKIMPQRYMNSYLNHLYPHQTKYDLLGTDGTWQQGDWLLHWPGTSLELRLQLAQEYSKLVVK